MKKIAIIGGGISGITSAIKLAKDSKNEIHVFEKRGYILKGPPYCHLHAGGILYPEISLKDAQNLLSDSIEFANYFRDCLEYRPTVVAYRKESKYCPNTLVLKCNVNKLYYQDSYSHPFGLVDNFYAKYTKDDIIYFKKYGKLPKSNEFGRKYHDKYVENFCKLIDDIEMIKYPFVSICEPGINQEKVEFKLIKQLKNHNNIKIYVNKNIELNDLNEYDIIINASGSNKFNTNKEMYEFKSSWLITTPYVISDIPEIAIIGERDTDNGMIQLTPIRKGLFQVHCMRQDSTIIKTSDEIFTPYLSNEEIDRRGNVAINEINKYFPRLVMNKVVGYSYGVQRIPYNNKSKRTSHVIKNGKYIDMYTLKATSIISLCNQFDKLII